MKKKNIILTGSEGLIGTSFRLYAEKKGHRVFCIDKIKKKRNDYFKCDILNELKVKELIKKIFHKNEINLLINNASFNPAVEKKLKKFEFSEYSLNVWKKNLEVDIFGTFIITKHVSKYFEKKGIGNILNISSIYGLVGPDQSIYETQESFKGFKPLEYSVAKAGMIGFTKALAAFYAKSKIKVNCLILGGVKNKQKKSFINKYNNKTILKRMAEVDEYNPYIDFFGVETNDYMTGSCIVVDGGATSIL